MSATDWLEIGIIVVLIVVVAFNAATEVAITRTNRVRALRLVEEGRRGAVALSRIAEDPAPYLNVVLLLTLLATIGGTTIATSFAVRHCESAGEIISTVAMTILLFVFAEVTPKTFAIQQTDRVGLMTAPILVFLTRLVGPFAKGLLRLANVIMPGKGLKQGPYITEQELRASAEVASEEGEIEDEEKELIHSIFEFGDTIVREVMVPRPDIVAIEDDKTLRDVQALVLEHGYSRDPRLPRGPGRRGRHHLREGRPEGAAPGQARRAAERDRPRAALHPRDEEGGRAPARDAARQVPHRARDRRVRLGLGTRDARGPAGGARRARSPTSTTARSPSSCRWATACTASRGRPRSTT